MDSNTFWINSGTSNFSPNLDPCTPYLSPKCLKTYKKNMEASLTNTIFHISTIRKSTISRFVDTTGHQTRGFVLVVFCPNLVGPKQLASQNVFKAFFGGGILINVGNLGIIKKY